MCVVVWDKITFVAVPAGSLLRGLLSIGQSLASNAGGLCLG